MKQLALKFLVAVSFCVVPINEASPQQQEPESLPIYKHQGPEPIPPRVSPTSQTVPVRGVPDVMPLGPDPKGWRDVPTAMTPEKVPPRVRPVPQTPTKTPKLVTPSDEEVPKKESDEKVTKE